ncbi:MAG TPA: bifunctional UDP-N-acetylglucosamine diphosphorylase/glucosamine-1-phosphate N-acetyltransferase GlmU [Candidatus Sulfotelmatobacter sp.]|jgi:bifunctional UDP-N-acetylglucosamine pyrophosphorylase/glucosamine-1-phosphate N-acetyltransferase|nr:bifunctional UDP-N-acetylglucosamine diphosphorylase/glucosamine-1-phosphate N-acetyltransferase GlmU [Candidatus Sulfotelmatobacter sp.]
MAQEKIAVIVLAAGMGTRMKSSLPKVMHPVAGRPMVSHLLDTVSALSPEKVVVVIGPGMEVMEKTVAPHPCVVQTDRLGTAHAVAQARARLEGFDGTVLILYGDTPLITLDTLKAMLAVRSSAARPAVVVLGFEPRDGGEYGRLVVGASGLDGIVEFKDATPEQRALPLCNSGVMAVDGKRLFALIDKVGNKNAKAEYYLTDIVALARAEGAACGHVEGHEDELLGVNSRSELAVAEALVQARLREAAMAGGATLSDPSSVYFSWDTKLGRDVSIEPNVVFAPGVSIGDNVEIRAFCHFAGVSVADGVVVGPFARLRPGAVIGEGAHIGNFVEVKQATVEAGAKINHLSYVGDARVGAGANVGAGTITCNYDGYNKHFTDIGAGAFIGSNSSLVAPVKIGDGAITGAGSVITKTVSPNALAVARGAQMELPGWGERFRARQIQAKADKSSKE